VLLMTSTFELQSLDSLLLIFTLVEKVEVTLYDICPTSVFSSLRNSGVAYLYWFIT